MGISRHDLLMSIICILIGFGVASIVPIMLFIAKCLQ
jgi:hypothetical protein